MLPSGCDQRASGQDTVAIPRFPDFNLADIVKPLGESRCKFFRHVLNHDDTGACTRQCRKNKLKCLGAPA